jgi:hypothetical protein
MKPNAVNESYKLYKVWAPPDGVWSPWVKPTLFLQTRWRPIYQSKGDAQVVKWVGADGTERRKYMYQGKWGPQIVGWTGQFQPPGQAADGGQTGQPQLPTGAGYARPGSFPQNPAQAGYVRPGSLPQGPARAGYVRPSSPSQSPGYAAGRGQINQPQNPSQAGGGALINQPDSPDTAKDIAPRSEAIATGVTREIAWLGEPQSSEMVIVDLPGTEGIIEGLSLCALGFRPVPLYNGTGPSDKLPLDCAVIQNEELASYLHPGAQIIQESNLQPTSPPAFLLDSRRLVYQGSVIGRYDNRWCVFPQDMPSVDFIRGQGIMRVIVRAYAIQNDLAHILMRYQDGGVPVYLCSNPDAEPTPFRVNKPSKFRSLAYRMSTVRLLKANSGGGFGGFIPIPEESSGYSG